MVRIVTIRHCLESIVAHFTKKVIWSDIKNIFFLICSIANFKKKEIPDHKCNKNVDGPSKALKRKQLFRGLNKPTHYTVYDTAK